jgi:tRNA pseudouridine55 synthase
MYTAKQFIEGTYLLIDKPMQWTSFDVIGKIRGPLQRFCNQKKLKVGHAGTLDPLATGLLIIVTGSFTKKAEELQTLDKEYTGTITLGGITPSYDAETEITQTFSLENITEEKIIAAKEKFTGTIEQVPPIYSSVKVDGRRAYSYARAGEELVIKSRNITIYSFEITGIELPQVHFKVRCSKGTYIRSLAHDLGKELGCGGYLSSLRRTRVGHFKIEDAISIEQFMESIRPVV